MNGIDPETAFQLSPQLYQVTFGTIFVLNAVGIAPMLAVAATCFTKISIVLLIVRNALGIQQTPPNILIYTVAILLSAYVMAPVFGRAMEAMGDLSRPPSTLNGWIELMTAAAEPIRRFLTDLSDASARIFFVEASKRIWGGEAGLVITETDYAALVPAFLVTELTRAFQIGFLLYLPFLVIDFVVSAVLIGLGMTMMSPPVIATPLKLLLFVAVDGWQRLLEGLVLSYAPIV